MHTLKVFIVVSGALFILDFLWLGILMPNFYKAEMGSLARLESGSFKPVVWAAVMVYILIPLGIVIFALPRVDMNNQIVSSISWGFLFGVILYGVYDMTNYSLVKGWPLRMALVDISWGGFLCACGTLAASFADKLLR